MNSIIGAIVALTSPSSECLHVALCIMPSGHCFQPHAPDMPSSFRRLASIGAAESQDWWWFSCHNIEKFVVGAPLGPLQTPATRIVPCGSRKGLQRNGFHVEFQTVGAVRDQFCIGEVRNLSVQYPMIWITYRSTNHRFSPGTIDLRFHVIALIESKFYITRSSYQSLC